MSFGLSQNCSHHKKASKEPVVAFIPNEKVCIVESRGSGMVWQKPITFKGQGRIYGLLRQITFSRNAGRKEDK